MSTLAVLAHPTRLLVFDCEVWYSARRRRRFSTDSASGRHGWVAEWLKAPVLKTGKGSRPSWVRIPPHPPSDIRLLPRDLSAIRKATVWDTHFMDIPRLIIGTISHGAALAVGIALGIYLLPILTAPDAPDPESLTKSAQEALFTAELTRDLRGSDFLHWGEGKISVTPKQIVHEGRLAPGPDYKLYLLDTFVEHEDEFLPLKSSARLIGDVTSFEGFLLTVPDDVDVSDYTTVLVWCEAFSEFITAARYR